MRINEITSGTKTELSINDLSNIKYECSIILSAMEETNTCLYRGVKNKSYWYNLYSNKTPEIFLGKTRDNRKSLSGSSKFQKAFDTELVKRGFKALRSNSIFCTTADVQAIHYGKLYVILPLNGFKYTWSPRINDLISVVNDPPEKTVELYQNTDLISAMKSGNEIMIHGEYYAILNEIWKEGR
jgi:hypothetical protein